VFQNLWPRGNITCTVQAANAAGVSPSSAGVSFVTDMAPPTGVAVTKVAANSLTVSWSAQYPWGNGLMSTGSNGFIISYSNGSTSQTTIVSGWNATSGTLTNLTTGVPYTIQVSAIGLYAPAGYQSSPWSSSVTATPVAPPSAISGLAVSNLTPTSVLLSWNA